MSRRKNWFRDKAYDEQLKLEEENKRVCKYCGYTMMIPSYKKKIECVNCRHFVFRDAKDEFEYRMKEQMNKRK